MADVYTFATQAQVRQQLANRLYDSSQVFWSAAELNLYLYEALQTWNALTSYWRNEFIFSTQAGVPYYDLTDLANLPNTLRPLTIQDTDLYTLIQYHLLEPAAWNPWTGVSAQFTADDLLNAVSRRRDEVLSVTGCTTTRRLLPAVQGRILLPDTVIDIRRVAYLPATGLPSVLFPEDTWAEQAFQSNYLQLPSGTPSTYLQSTQPPISFDTDIAPGFAGQYELLTVEAGPRLTVGTPTTLIVPDDFTHVIKWGALADLLSRESNAKDVLRAKYCESRYRMGLTLLSNAPALFSIRFSNKSRVLQIDSLRAADLYRTGWQGESAAEPDTALHSGLNLVVLAPVPDSNSGNNYSLTATVVQNAPIPANDGAFVQVAREDLDAILDYAQHLASFKNGGAEFMATVPLFQRFMDCAALYNTKLKELGEFMTSIYGLSQSQEQDAPRIAEMPSGS